MLFIELSVKYLINLKIVASYRDNFPGRERESGWRAVFEVPTGDRMEQWVMKHLIRRRVRNFGRKLFRFLGDRSFPNKIRMFEKIVISPHKI
jgi:hypothetical protein